MKTRGVGAFRVLSVVALLFVPVFLCGTFVSADSDKRPTSAVWPMLGHDAARTGLSPFAAEDPVWNLRCTFPAGSRIFDPPVLEREGEMYFGTEAGRVLKLDADCRVLWERSVSGPVVSLALTSKGNVLVPSGDGLHAFTSAGVPLWTFPTGAFVERPAVVAGKAIYVAAHNGILYALDLRGRELWRYTFGGLASWPAVGPDGTIYVAPVEGELHAVSPKGHLRWRATTGCTGAGEFCEHRIAVGKDGTVYVGADDGVVYAFNSKGRLRWTYDTEFLNSEPGLALGHGGRLYVGSSTEEIVALDRHGEELWSFAAGGALGAATLGGDRWIFGGDSSGRLQVLDRRGVERFRFQADGFIRWGASVDRDGSLVFGTYGGTVYRLDALCEDEDDDDGRAPSSAWTKDPGVRLDVVPSTLESVAVSPGSVITLPGGGMRMYYQGSEGIDVRIFSATSTDGLTWTRDPGVRLDVQGAQETEVGAPAVIPLDGGLLRMYYSGMEHGTVGASRLRQSFRIFSAISSDGLMWTREGLRLGFGNSGSPDQFGVQAPEVVPFPQGGFRMYYAGFDGDFDRVLSATSQDGLTWTRESGVRVDHGAPGSFSEIGVGNPFPLLLDEGGVRMYYVASMPGNELRAILSANSPDGLTFTEEEGVRIDRGPLGAFDDCNVGAMLLLPGNSRMLYGGIRCSDGRHRVLSAVANLVGDDDCGEDDE